MAYRQRRWHQGPSADLGASVVEVRLMTALILVIVLLVTAVIVGFAGRDYQDTCSELAATGIRAGQSARAEGIVDVCRS